MSMFRRLTLALAALAAVGGPRTALAADAALEIVLDRDVAAPGEPFACEVHLTVATNGDVESYRAPDFKGLRVISAPQGPSRSTQMQIGGGQTYVRNDYTWHYEVVVPPGAKGPVTIGAARARVAGHDLKSNAVTLRVGSGPPAGNPRRGGGGAPSPFDLFGQMPQEPSASSSGAGQTFLRVVADKSRVYVGEPVVVTWSICSPQPRLNASVTTEARTDGFWSEDVPSAVPRGQAVEETIGGRTYYVSTLARKALFPLREGKLVVTSMEAEVAQMVGFFNMGVRAEKIKGDAVAVEALPLPREGQPAGFDASNVGAYELEAHADRTTVAVGEAVTVTVAIKGVGNVRNVRLPALAAPAGWKSYSPKETVNLDAPGGVGGTKVVELLLLPERAGTVMLPAIELPTFDPATKRYVTLKSEPLRLDATGDAAPTGTATRGPGAGGPAVENVIGAALRPIRARTRLGRDVGTTFLHSRAFGWLLFLPPFAFVLTGLVDRVRERLALDTRRTRRRRMRTMVRKRLSAAVAHRDAGLAAAFYIEIDRVLREVLAARLGGVVTGLRRDELEALLAERGMPGDLTARLLTELEACDQARFAPGGEAEGAAAMGATLERADELIGLVEKATLRDEGRP